MGEIVRRKCNGNAIPQNDADAKLAHTAAELGPDGGALVGGHLKLASGKDLRHHPIELDVVVTLILLVEVAFVVSLVVAFGASFRQPGLSFGPPT